jgi:3-phenylpropionate/trans-cinnamate dioxygenase ferredoxin reductase component
MSEKKYRYVIIGSGLAGTSAIEGIREIDKRSPILLIGNEHHMPYDRPHLSKKLWFGKKKVEEIFLHDKAYYIGNNVDLALGETTTRIVRGDKLILTGSGESIHYERLLIATGGSPRRLEVPGGDLDQICYFRTLDDYNSVRALLSEGKRAVIIGGGFIGSELAAALNTNKIDVTMIFPEEYLVQRIFPHGLGHAIQDQYIARGITVMNNDIPVSFKQSSGHITTRTRSGKEVQSDIVIAGIGIAPETGLAGEAGLSLDNGIVVDEYLTTSDADIFAAGDNASFLYVALGKRMRLEHWDNSIAQGKTAGSNMAGAKSVYDHIPYFFSDLFEFGYEAAGDISSRLETYAVWKKEFEKGVVYYLENGIVRGVMLCNVWDRIPVARELIRARKHAGPDELKDAIPIN